MDSKEATSKAAATEKSGGRLHSFMVRAGAGIVYAALFIGSLLFGVVPTAVFASVMSVLCCYEFYRIMRLDGKVPNEFVGLVASVLFPLSVLVDPVWLTVINFLLVLLLGLWYVKNPRTRIADVAVTAFGAIYTGLIMSTAILLRESLSDPWGAVLVLGLFVSVWGSDTFAYLVGSAIGKHKLAPHISPNKSWEGFIAGLVFAMAVWCLLSFIPGVTMSIPLALAFGLINGLAGVLGDLVESRIKRNSGFKDSGTIMPGHGGLLDRCDSQFLVTLSGAILLVLGGCIPYVF